MKKIILSVVMISFVMLSYGQVDTLNIKLTKRQVDIINTVFQQREVLDSLNSINTIIIGKQEIKIENLQYIINDKDSVIIGKDSIIAGKDYIMKNNEIVIKDYKKELKKEKIKKNFFKAGFGVAILVIIIILI